MLTKRFISNTLIFLFTIVIYVSAVPIQLRDATVTLNNGGYGQPELAETFAGYAELDWDEENDLPMKRLIIPSRNLDHLGGGNLLRSISKRSNDNDRYVGFNNLDSIGGGILLMGSEDNAHINHISRQSHHGRDSLTSGIFGESKRYTPPRKSEWPNNLNGLEIYEGSAKRNIDEIDRTGFDNFLKRNFDEIDRAGWDSFVKRRMINSYLVNKQH